jgi:neutral ceramidase
MLLLVFAMTAAATERGPLRAGVAKVDITPPDLTGLTNLWGTQFEGVHDKIYARALVLDNSTTTAAVIAADLVEFGDTTEVRQRIAKEAGIPADNIFISATHDYSAPRAGKVSPGGTARRGGAATAVYSAFVDDRILEAVREAKMKLQPAKVGVGAGNADVNINREQLTAQGWRIGVNPDRVSDKTVWVVKFETLNGEPIAFFVNYAVRSVVMGPENKLLTGDLAGATSRYIEQHFNDKVVALWTCGSVGDQNPKFITWDYTFTQKTLQHGFSLVDSQGQILAEETLRTAGNIQHQLSDIRLMAAQKILTCPANTKPNPNRPAEVLVPPSAQVNIRLGLLMIDRIALANVSGEVVTPIYWRLKKESPFTNTIMVSLVNDRIGYIADDVAYDTPFFELSGTPVARNCAEPGIVNGMLEMMDEF